MLSEVRVPNTECWSVYRNRKRLLTFRTGKRAEHLCAQSVVDRSDRPNPPVAAQIAKERLEEEVQAARNVGGVGKSN